MMANRPTLRLIHGGAARAYTVACSECGDRLVAADRIGDREQGAILHHLRRKHDRFLFGAPLLGELLRHVRVEYRQPAPHRPTSIRRVGVATVTALRPVTPPDEQISR